MKDENIQPLNSCARIPGRSGRGLFSAECLFSGWSLALLAVGLCWLLLFSELSGEWRINAQYNFGFVVPLLGLVLLWRRWPERPAARAPASRVPAARIAAALLLLALPIRVVLEANPEWRLLYWLNGFQVLGITFCFLYMAGGWSWVGYFAFPLALMLIAVPWPMGLEQAIVQGLMRFVAGLTAGVADCLAIPAVQHGNVIETAAGLVGIDEACSGVRSLQSALMLSLFLGEMHRFSALRRLRLLGASVIFVLLANISRTTLLVWVAANRGLREMESWHDSAGIVVMLIVLPGLMLLAHFLKPKTCPAPSGPPADGNFPRPVPRWVGIGITAWIGLALVATEAWYRSHETRLIPNPHWSVAWPRESAQFKDDRIPENALVILRCSQTQAASWRDEFGNRWGAFLLRWAPGKNSAQLAKGHRPEICLPASGATKRDDFGRINLNCGTVDLVFEHQSFESQGALLHVFYCLWSDRRSPARESLAEDGSRSSRLEAVLAGKRHLGQQVLEITIEGPDTREAAEAVLRGALPKLIRQESG